jgi:hypothetical protein
MICWNISKAKEEVASGEWLENQREASGANDGESISQDAAGCAVPAGLVFFLSRLPGTPVPGYSFGRPCGTNVDFFKLNARFLDC